MGDQICKEPCFKDDCIGAEEKKDETTEFNVGNSGAFRVNASGTATRQSSIHNTPSESSNVDQHLAKGDTGTETCSRLESSSLNSRNMNSRQQQQRTNSKNGSTMSAKLKDQSEKVKLKKQPSLVEPAVWNEVSDGSGGERTQRGTATRCTAQHQGGKIEPKAGKHDAADITKNSSEVQGGKDETQVRMKNAVGILADPKKYAAGVPENLVYRSANESVAAVEISSASNRRNAWALCEALWARAAEKAATEHEAWPRLDFKRNLADIVAEAEESASAVAEDCIYRAACDSFVAVEVSSAAGRQAAWALCDAMWAKAAEKGAKGEESWHLFA